jgi:MFS transporter, DHA2 family, glioxin efflux transporter
MAFFALGSVLNGGLIGKTRIFHLYMLMGGLLAVAGAALFYAMDHDSSKAR